jgi:hypothetical protein
MGGAADSLINAEAAGREDDDLGIGRGDVVDFPARTPQFRATSRSRRILWPRGATI